MAASYKAFLASPDASLLADQASLYYVTTLTTFHGAEDIIKHLAALQKQVTKKQQDVINVIDGGSVVAFEVNTGLEFQTSGGVYLPRLDDNFLTDRLAILPMMHIVTFDAQGKIAQIRIQWDQGALLKQLDIIGKTGRNWPIQDSREQLAMIQTCIRKTGAVSAAPSQTEATTRGRGTSSHATRDPHASLHMMGSREENEAQAAASMVSPYAGHRPNQRSFTDILGDNPDPTGAEAESATGSVVSPYAGHRPQQRSFTDILGDESLEQPSPSKPGKPAKTNRLFEGQEDQDTPKAKGQTYIRPHSTKYDHFSFADGSDPQDQPKGGKASNERAKGKHDSQWSFDDFNAVGKPGGPPRPDAVRHFELKDDGEDAERPARQGPPMGSGHNEGLGLYKNNLFNQEATPGPKRALGNVTNLSHRNKDFDPHFAISDKSPSQNKPEPGQHMTENQKKSLQTMSASWASYDQSPTVSQKENFRGDGTRKEDSRIAIAGDGMGGRKGTNRDWLYGDESAQSEGQSQPQQVVYPRKGVRDAQARQWDF